MLGDPRVGLLVHLQGGGEQLGQRLGPGDLLQGGHTLLVVHSLGLHRGDRLAAGGALLGVEQRARVVQGGLDDADDVDRVLRGLHVQQVHGRQGEGCQGLVEGEVGRQVHGQAEPRAPVGGGLGAGDVREDARRAQGQVDFQGAAHVPAPLGLGLVGALQQIGHRRHRVAGALHEVQHHGGGDLELAGQRLRGRVAQPLEGLVRPVDAPLGGLLAHDLAALALVVAGLGQRLGVLDDVLGCLDDDVAAGVEAGAPGPSGDLVELARGEVALLGAVELHQRGHDHRADRHVDPHPERVRAADDGQQPFAGQALHQSPVSRQHARVVHADPGAQQP